MKQIVTILATIKRLVTVSPNESSENRNVQNHSCAAGAIA